MLAHRVQNRLHSGPGDAFRFVAGRLRCSVPSYRLRAFDRPRCGPGSTGAADDLELDRRAGERPASQAIRSDRTGNVSHCRRWKW